MFNQVIKDQKVTQNTGTAHTLLGAFLGERGHSDWVGRHKVKGRC